MICRNCVQFIYYVDVVEKWYHVSTGFSHCPTQDVPQTLRAEPAEQGDDQTEEGDHVDSRAWQ